MPRAAAVDPRGLLVRLRFGGCAPAAAVVVRGRVGPGGGGRSGIHSLYRRALALRHELLALERLEWVETGRGDVLRFRRPNGREVVTVFGSAPLALSFMPGQRVVLSSTPLDGDTVPGETTVWITGD